MSTSILVRPPTPHPAKAGVLPGGALPPHPAKAGVLPGGVLPPHPAKAAALSAQRQVVPAPPARPHPAKAGVLPGGALPPHPAKAAALSTQRQVVAVPPAWPHPAKAGVLPAEALPPHPAKAAALSAQARLAPGRAAIQLAKFKVTVKTLNGNNIQLTISGRPGWSAQVMKKCKPSQGQSRGHVIEWNTMVRAFKANVAGSKQELLKIIDSTKQSDSEITAATIEYLKKIYNNRDNIVLNNTAEDNEAGGKANELAQRIDQMKPGSARTEILKQLFPLSFNPVDEKMRNARLDKYISTFEKAWGVEKQILSQWARELGWLESGGGKSTEGVEKSEAPSEKKRPRTPERTTTSRTSEEPQEKKQRTTTSEEAKKTEEKKTEEKKTEEKKTGEKKKKKRRRPKKKQPITERK